MAILCDYLKQIADAIRYKKETTAPICAQNFCNEIRNMPGAEELNNFIKGTSTSIVIPDGVTTIRSYLCQNFSKLTEITIPDGVITIDKYAFDGVYVDKIVIPESVTTINRNAFYLESSNEKSIYLPSKTPNLGDSCIKGSNISIYHNCNLIDYITYFPSNSTSYIDCLNGTIPHKRFLKNESNEYYLVEKLNIPSSVTSLPKYLFYGFMNLKELNLPPYLKTIENNAIQFTNINEIVIPSSVTSIGSSFYSQKILGGSNIKMTYIFNSTTPPTIQSYTFNVTYLNKIFVPTGCGATYRSATNWSAYASYIFEPNEAVSLNVASSLLNNANYLYSTDSGTTWNQFTSETMNLQYIQTIWFKNLTADTTIKIGSTAGGSEIGTIANAELKHTTSANEVIYIGV